MIFRSIFKLINYEDEFRKTFSAVVIQKPSLNPCQVKAQIVAVEVLKVDRLKNLSVDLETKRQEAETLECQKREMHDRKKKNC